MSAFKVGQRVKVVSLDGDTPFGTRVRVDMEGTILSADSTLMINGWTSEWKVSLDALSTRHGPYRFMSRHLAPLTDPKAEQFIAAIKKLKPYSEPLVKRIGEKA